MTLKDVPKKAACRPQPQEPFGEATDNDVKLRVCHMRGGDAPAQDESIDVYFFDDPRTPEMNGQLSVIEVGLRQLQDASNDTMLGYLEGFDNQYGPTHIVEGKIQSSWVNLVKVCGPDGACKRGGIELLKVQQPLRGMGGPIARLHALDAQDRASALAAKSDGERASKEEAQGAKLVE